MGVDATEWIGLSAGLLTTIAFVPQALKTWRTQSATDFSLKMLVLFTVGVALWLLYGLLRKQIAVILPNTVTLLLSAYILSVKLRRKGVAG